MLSRSIWLLIPLALLLALIGVAAMWVMASSRYIATLPGGGTLTIVYHDWLSSCEYSSWSSGKASVYFIEGSEFKFDDGRVYFEDKQVGTYSAQKSLRIDVAAGESVLTDSAGQVIAKNSAWRSAP